MKALLLCFCLFILFYLVNGGSQLRPPSAAPLTSEGAANIHPNIHANIHVPHSLNALSGPSAKLLKMPVSPSLASQDVLPARNLLQRLSDKTMQRNTENRNTAERQSPFLPVASDAVPGPVDSVPNLLNSIPIASLSSVPSISVPSISVPSISVPRRLEEEISANRFALSVSFAVLLALLSAVFSGLTLGLMMLDVVQLKVLIEAAEKQPDCPISRRDAMRARRIYRLRKDGNLLLVTLLVGNVSVNSAFSIITSDLTSGLVGFLLSTSIITLFGEIVPQAVCSRYGLATGYYLCPVIFLVEILLYVIVKPISLILDWFLGQDIGTSYSKEQLKAFVGHHQTEAKVLNREEAQIIFGGLDVAAKKVASAMTSISKVFGISVDKDLDFDTAAQMVTSGFSRVPVFDKSQHQSIVGLLYTKDISLIDPSLQLPVRSVLSMFGRPIYGVDMDTPLLDVLAEFKKGHSHLAVVREVVDDGVHDRYYRHIGIITLEDIIEEILQDEIVDEYELQSASAGGDHPVNVIAVVQPSQKREEKAKEKTFCAILRRKKKVNSTQQEPSNVEATTSDSDGRPATPFQLLGGPRGVGDMSASTDLPPSVVQRNETSNITSTLATAPQTPSTSSDMLVTLPPTVLAPAPAPTPPTPVNSTHTSPDLQASHSEDHTAKAMLGRLRLFNRRRSLEQLAQNEASAICLFLMATIAPFRPPYVDTESLQRMLLQCVVEEPPEGTVQYTRGTAANFLLLILQGRVDVVSGDDEVKCTLGPWNVLGTKALGPPNLSKVREGLTLVPSASTEALSELDHRLQQWEHNFEYVPDFTACAAESHRGAGLRCVRLSRQLYLQSVKATLIRGPISMAPH